MCVGVAHQAVGPGDIDVTDGNYYCMKCWEAFQVRTLSRCNISLRCCVLTLSIGSGQTADKMEAMTLQPAPAKAPAKAAAPATPKLELSKDEKLLSYLSKEEAMVGTPPTHWHMPTFLVRMPLQSSFLQAFAAAIFISTSVWNPE